MNCINCTNRALGRVRGVTTKDGDKVTEVDEDPTVRDQGSRVIMWKLRLPTMPFGAGGVIVRCLGT